MTEDDVVTELYTAHIECYIGALHLMLTYIVVLDNYCYTWYSRKDLDNV